MAAQMLSSVYLTVNSVDYSDHLKSAVLTLDRASLDTTDFDSGGWTEAIPGLRSGTLAVTFIDDLADDDVDEELYALWNADTATACALKVNDATISTSNPEYQFNVVVTSYTLGGGVGELAGKTLTWPITGSVTRDITA